MTVIAPERKYTPDDLLTLPEGKHLELVNGRLVEKERGAEAAWTSGELLTELKLFVRGAGCGRIFPSEMGYQCFAEDRNRIRKPDVSFVSAERLPEDWRTYGFFPFPPDLAVEVVSPNDLYSEVTRKVREYLDAGVKLVWVLDPEARCAEVHRADGTSAFLREDGELTGEGVLPGFQCALGGLFGTPAANQG